MLCTHLPPSNLLNPRAEGFLREVVVGEDGVGAEGGEVVR